MIVEKRFEDLSKLARSLTSLLSIGEPHVEVLEIYGLKGSEEQVIFYEEPVETPTSPTTETPSLVLDSPSNNSMSELLLDQGESTGSVLGHGPPVGVSPGPYVTLVLPTLVTRPGMSSTASSQRHSTPRPPTAWSRPIRYGSKGSSTGKMVLWLA